MSFILHKSPFLIELILNGLFILLYSLKTLNKFPGIISNRALENLLEYGAWFIPFVIFLVIVTNYLSTKGPNDFVRKHIFSIVVFIPLVITWGDQEFAYLLASAHLLSSIMSLYDDERKKDRQKKAAPKFNIGVLKIPQLSPAQLVLLSFVGVILFGTFLLMLPPSAAEGKTISFVDGLFMATSATCVTGLSTFSISDTLSFFGQMVILVLIQVGGLSIMTLYSSMAILLGRSMGMRDRIIMQDLLDVSGLDDLFAMIIDIVKFTLIIELWGGLILSLAFTFEGFEIGKAIYYGMFHSISAFCNAGFSLFNNSLESYATNPLIHGTISVLIIVGGLGFIVLKELKNVIVNRQSLVRVALHTKVVVVTTAGLILVGTVFIFFSEFLNSMDSYSLYEKLQISFFQSVTLRTAGFNTIPLNQLNTFTIYGMSLFMFIGASPGSTGGGVKTTTLAILVQSIKSTLKGQKEVQILDRTITPQLVVKTVALTVISIIITSFFILLVIKIEPKQSFLAIFFEVLSASGTVGLSLGLTPQLSVMGKMAFSLLMLIGRIGPLTLILAIGDRRKQSAKIEFPDGKIMIG
jgi:trk system potassium uptake protein